MLCDKWGVHINFKTAEYGKDYTFKTKYKMDVFRQKKKDKIQSWCLMQ